MRKSLIILVLAVATMTQSLSASADCQTKLNKHMENMKLMSDYGYPVGQLGMLVAVPFAGKTGIWGTFGTAFNVISIAGNLAYISAGVEQIRMWEIQEFYDGIVSIEQFSSHSEPPYTLDRRNWGNLDEYMEENVFGKMSPLLKAQKPAALVRFALNGLKNEDLCPGNTFLSRDAIKQALEERVLSHPEEFSIWDNRLH